MIWFPRRASRWSGLLSLACLLPAAGLPRLCRAQLTQGDLAVTAAGAGERVGGRVVDAQDGRALAHATLALENNKTDKVVAEAVSGIDGSFRFAAVPAGRYRLTGRIAGYLQSAYLQHGELSSAVVTGAGLATGTLVLRLTPSARILGQVVDETREPLLHATVSLYREAVSSTAAEKITRVRTAQTQDDGRYEFRNLGDGRYFVVATGMPWYAVHPVGDGPGTAMPYRFAIDPELDVAYPPLFFDGGLRSDRATPIALHAGETFTADMQMVPTPAVTLTLQNSHSSGEIQSFPNLVRSIFGSEEVVPIQGTVVNGVQQITGLAPGEYELQQFGNGNRTPVSSEKVDLTGSSASLAVGADAPALAAVSVQVRALDGAVLPSGLQMNLRDLRRRRRFATSAVDAKGMAEFGNVPVGEYRPVLFHAGVSMGLAAVTVKGIAVPDREIRVTGVEGIHAEVVTSGEPVTVTGVVQYDGKPAVGVTVILVPAGADSNEILFRHDQSDLDGGFTLPNVVPGNYIAVAVEDGGDLAWTDVKTLGKYLAKGVPVIVRPGSSSRVRVPEPVFAQPK